MVGDRDAATVVDATERSFLQDLPVAYRPRGDVLAGELEVTDALLVPRHPMVRISVLASVADMATGVLASENVRPSIALTVDLSVRMIRPATVGSYELRSRVVKQGRTLTSTEAWLYRRGEAVAQSWVTFMASPRPGDTLPTIHLERPVTRTPMQRPFAEELGLRTISPGVAEVDRRPYTLQPTGALQGGVVCALAEEAAMAVMGQPVTEMTVHYLSAVREGPGRASAEVTSPRTASVAIRDAGADEKMTSITFARCDQLAE